MSKFDGFQENIFPSYFKMHGDFELLALEFSYTDLPLTESNFKFSGKPSNLD